MATSSLAEVRDLQVDLEALGRNIRGFRQKRDMTLMDLAARIGGDPPQMSRIERGMVEPELRTLLRIAAALGVKVSKLLP